MPRHFHSISIAALALAMAHNAAHAQTTVNTESSTALRTSTNGDIVIGVGGELEVADGNVITVDSNNSVIIRRTDDDEDDDDDFDNDGINDNVDDDDDNDGDLDRDDDNDFTVSNGIIRSESGQSNISGIAVTPGRTFSITNDGGISVLEDFEADDDDRNGIVDGPIASASGRYGIYVGGPATANGTINNTGGIFVEGLSSGGIVVDAPLNGSIRNTGTISVIGDGGVGIRTQSVTGDVTVLGSINVVGEGSVGASFEGPIGGTLLLQGGITQGTGFTTDDGLSLSLSRRDLRVGAPAVVVSGSVAGGILVGSTPVTDNPLIDDDDEEDDEDFDNDGIDNDDDDDDDNDGIDDVDEGVGSISSVGNGPAMQIGGAQAMTVGTVAARLGGTSGGYSLVVDGSISSNARYSGTDSIALVIGTANGGAVNMPGGIEVTGTISTTALDGEATALLIRQQNNVPRIYNSGAISASITSEGEGSAIAIRDLSGTLTSIENTGTISATGVSEGAIQAINLSANTSGVTISQFLNAADLETREEIEEDANEDNGPDDEYIEDTTVYASITGNIVTGSGNDNLLVSHGIIRGNSFLNGGLDTVRLSEDSQYDGDIDFGTGDGLLALSNEAIFAGNVEARNQAVSITLADDARYFGSITGGSQTDVVVNGGRFGTGEVSTTQFRSLTVRSGGALDVYIDGEEGTSSKIIVDTATFETGSEISATVTSLENVEGSYNILTAATVNGRAAFDEATTGLPFIYNGTISYVANDVFLNIRRKTATELGLNKTASQGYDAIITAIVEAEDETLTQSILDIDNAERLQEEINELLPDHAGGVFDTVTRNSRLAGRHLTDDAGIFDPDTGTVAAWLEPIYWKSQKKQSDTSGYENQGQGVTFGMEWAMPAGHLGLSYSYLSGKLQNGESDGRLKSTQHEVGGFYRITGKNFYGFAKISAAAVSIDSTRIYEGTIDDDEFTRTTESDWSGVLLGGTMGASYNFDVGSRFSLKPMVIADYYWLKENSYEENGGGEAIDLDVDGRTSSAATITTSLTAAYRFGKKRTSGRGTPLTIELEAGRRGVLLSDLGATTAVFQNEDEDAVPFTISGGKIKKSNLLEARILGGGFDFTWRLSGRAEQYDGKTSYGGRASFSVAF
ncbi:MAG: autotransporter outer membrane beta-barrel domain-containing protein [Sphingomonadaceae bacterium]|nr:autotransporter outer membrane beta-barrel domain-containing protein [Sphingomonadaceae bacterium]